MSHVDESFHRGVHMGITHDSCHKEMSRVTCDRVMSHMNELCSI